MRNEEDLIKRLSFENYIWLAYIIAGVLSIYGDELIKKSIKENDKYATVEAIKIFNIVITIFLSAGIYFLIRNYSDLQKHPNDKKYEVRLLGSILIFSGTLSFVYFQKQSENESKSFPSSRF